MQMGWLKRKAALHRRDSVEQQSASIMKHRYDSISYSTNFLVHANALCSLGAISCNCEPLTRRMHEKVSTLFSFHFISPTDWGKHAKCRNVASDIHLLGEFYIALHTRPVYRRAIDSTVYIISMQLSEVLVNYNSPLRIDIVIYS